VIRREEAIALVWSAVAKCNGDTALDSLLASWAGKDHDGRFIQSGMALRFPPQSMRAQALVDDWTGM